MLGHLYPSNCSKSELEESAYKKFYCSLCGEIKVRHKLPYSLIIPHEIVFVLLSVSETLPFEESEVPCPASLGLVKKPAFKAEIFEMAADMSVVLAWLKLLDKKTDEKFFGWSVIWKQVNRKFLKIKSKLYPETIKNIEYYSNLITSKSENYIELKEFSGIIAESITREIAGKTAIESTVIEVMAALFNKIGKTVFIADALIDIHKDIQHNSYNPVLTHVKQNNSTISIEYEKIYGDFIDLHWEILNQVKNPDGTNEEFCYALTTALNNLSRKVSKERYAVVENKSDRIEYIEKLILNNQHYILAHNSYCECVKSGCEYDGCCSKKTCYGDNCNNCCCGGDCFGRNSSGCTCCGYSCWGDFCLGYSNACDCMCGCGGGQGCCCDFSVWKNTAAVLAVGALVYWIFGHFWQTLLVVLVAVGIIGFIFLRKSKKSNQNK